VKSGTIRRPIKSFFFSLQGGCKVLFYTPAPDELLMSWNIKQEIKCKFYLCFRVTQPGLINLQYLVFLKFEGKYYWDVISKIDIRPGFSRFEI
jgi:hypothetical protein